MQRAVRVNKLGVQWGPATEDNRVRTWLMCSNATTHHSDEDKLLPCNEVSPHSLKIWKPYQRSTILNSKPVFNRKSAIINPPLSQNQLQLNYLKLLTHSITKKENLPSTNEIWRWNKYEELCIKCTNSCYHYGTQRECHCHKIGSDKKFSLLKQSPSHLLLSTK